MKHFSIKVGLFVSHSLSNSKKKIKPKACMGSKKALVCREVCKIYLNIYIYMYKYWLYNKFRHSFIFNIFYSKKVKVNFKTNTVQYKSSYTYVTISI